MKKISFTIVLYVLGISASLAQEGVPAEASSVVGLSLDDAATKLESNGYEIAYSSFFGKKQYWWNVSEKVCINVAFHKGKDHLVETVTMLADQECTAGIEAAHKMWERYHDGQAPINSSAVAKQREKLISQGFKVSYWIQDASPGHSMEYWYNEKTNKCKYIGWNTSGGDGVFTGNSTPEQAKNPAPVKK